MRNALQLSVKPHPAHHFSRLKLYVAVLAASHWVASGQTWAAPEGGKVVGGGGVIEQTGVETIITQATERMAIDWRSFDVAANERVEFIQPNSSSVALNRVLSNRGSEILGRIDANGQVILVNTHGVVFGKDAVVNVGGIIASGLSIDTDSFINGDFALNSIENAESKVINYGIINAATGGSVSLIGTKVQNEGLISAKLGAVNLVAGNAAVLTFDPSGMVGVRITEAVVQNELGVDAAVINNGAIVAEGGRVLLSASVSEDVFSNAVNNAGMSKSSSVVVHEDGSFTLGAGADLVNTGAIDTSVNEGTAGQVVLLGNNITHSGSIKADSGTGTGGSIELHSTDVTQLTGNASLSAQASKVGEGGDIKVLGNKVGLFNQTDVDASGAQGGGQVLIGGDKTGDNIQIRNANFIYLDENTSVKTDALINGNGGKLITFASDTARIYGNVYSRGGSQGGNGGFIETSGLKGFDILNTPDITAVAGMGGTWLIDPYNIVINNGNNDLSGGNPFESSNGETTLGVDILVDALTNGALVEVRTGSGGTDSGNITLNNDLLFEMSSSATLRLQAHNSISLNSNIQRLNTNINGALNIELIANADNSGGGDISVTNGKNIVTNGGYFYAGVRKASGADDLNNDGFLDGDLSTPTLGSFTSTGALINTSGTQTVASSGYSGGGGDIVINARGAVNLGEMLFRTNAGNVDSQRKLLQVGSVTVFSRNDVSLNGRINFNDTGKRTGTGLKGYDGNLLDNQDTNLTISAWGNINIKAGIADGFNDNGAPAVVTHGGDDRDALNISLTADANNNGSGSIDIDADIYTGGGNFSVKGINVYSDGFVINTDRANPSLTNDGDYNGDAEWSNGGNVSIEARDTIKLGDIVTDSSCATPTTTTCTGNLSLAGIDTDIALAGMQSTVFIEQAVLKVAGTTLINIGQGNASLNNSANTFNKAITIQSANNVSLRDSDINGMSLGAVFVANNLALNSSGDITQTGEINIGGTTDLVATGKNILLNNTSNNFEGQVTVSAGSLALVDANDLAIASINMSGGSTGNISLTSGAANKIILNDNLISTAGTQNAIFLNSNVEIATNLQIDAGTGAIDFNGTVDSEIAIANNLTLSGGDITFAEDVGTNSKLGNFLIGSSGNVTFADVIAGSFNLTSANSISAQSITTSGADSSTGDGESGGAVTMTAGTIILDTINTSGGNSTGAGNHIGGTAGAITLSANSASGSKFITINNNLIAAAGTGSNGGAAGAAGAIQLTLANTGIAGQVNLNANSFIYSSINVIGLGTADTFKVTNTHNTWELSNTNEGTVRHADNLINSPVINFTGFENITGGSDVDIFDITHNISNSINGGGNTDTFKINVSSLDAVVNGGTGADDFYLNVATTKASLNGDAGNDVFSVNTTGSITATLNGGADADTINSANRDNIWLLGTTENLNTTLLFSQIENIEANAGKDSFTFIGARAVSGTINAAGHSEDEVVVSTDGTIDYAGSDFLLQGVSNAEHLRSENGGTLSVASDSGNTINWSFDSSASVTNGINQVEILGFTSFVGGNGNDVFAVGNYTFTALLNGGGGTDTFNLLNSSASPYSIVIDEDFNVGSNATLNSFEIIDATNNLNTSLQVLLGINTNWTITGQNNGNVVNTDIGTVEFINIATLVGGAGTDNFAFDITGAISGTVDGSDGNDSITARNSDSTWSILGENTGNISTTEATPENYLASFINVENLLGSSANDTFTFSDNASVVSAQGNGGVDVADLSAITSDITVTIGAATSYGFSGVERLIANNQRDFTLATSSGSNIWMISDFDDVGSVSDGVNDGTVAGIQFVDFKNLQGATGVDTFNLNTNFTGNIFGLDGNDIFNIRTTIGGSLSGGNGADNFVFFDGGSLTTVADGGTDAAIDRVDMTNITNDVTVILNGSTISNVNNVERVIANGQRNFTLAASSGSNVWTISDFDNAGNVSDGVNDGTVAGIEFVDFKNLQGGTGVDTFDLHTNFTGNVLGLSGDDIFNIRTAVAGSLFGGNGADSFVFFNGASLSATANGGTDIAIDQVDMTNITSDITVTLNGSTINNVGGVERVIANNQRNFTLAASAGSNTWTISDFDNADNVSDGVNDGTVAGIQFVDFKNLQGGTGVDTFNLNTNFIGNIFGLEGDDIFNIHAAIAGSLSGGDGADNFVFFNGGSLSNVADGGDDASVDQVSMANITTDITVILDGSTINNVNNVERVIANSQRNFTLAASSGSNIWIISDFDDADSVSDGVNDGIVAGIQFVDFKNLQGGTGVDTFNLNTNFTGNIFGQDGNDIFNIRTAITGNLSGGDDADRFVFFDGGSLSTVADGGSDAALDRVDLTNITSDITVTLNGSTINNVNNVNNVERVIANSQRNFTLAASSGTNIWTIFDFDNAGNLSDGINDGTVAGIQFVDFGTLVGGSGADTFNVDQSGSIASVNGGLGENSLVGRNSANTWRATGPNSGNLSVTNGGVYVASFNNIQNLVGGTGVDTFELNAQISSSVNGGQGNDQFLVNAASSSLLGGEGNDHFIFNSINNSGSAASIDGGIGENTVTGRDITNSWSISNTNEGTLSVTDGATYISGFTNIQSIVGGNFADIFEINADITTSIQSGNGNNIFRINTHVNQLQGGANDDQFIFGLSGSANSIIGGVGVNSLYARNEDNNWTISSPNAGRIQTSTSVTYVDNFSGIQILNGGNSADTFILNAAADSILGNAGNDTFSFSNNGRVNAIDGGLGINTLNGRNQSNNWIMSSANTGVVSANSIYVGNFQNIGVLGGGSASDVLIASNQANRWEINETNAGVLRSATTPSANVSFTSIENLRGNEGADQFIFSVNGNLSGLLDGGTTPTLNSIQDTLNLSAINGILTVELGNQNASALNVVNVEVITASASNQDNHVLLGANNTPYLWKITSQNQGMIETVTNPLLETSVNFVNFGDLRGGTNSDRFIVQSSVTKSIDGGDGIDFIDYSQRTENFVVVLGGSGGFGITGINGIEGVVGNSALGGGYTSSIQVESGNNIWEIGTTSNFSDGINDGSVTINNSKITFENFTYLNGGSGEDIFNYIENGQWTGTIDGGEGNNVINTLVSTKDQQFFVNGSGMNSGTILKNIDQLIANKNTNSILVSNLQANSWVIDSSGNGSLNNSLNFMNLSSLIGGTFNDIFNISDISSLRGMIDGGLGNGNDTINIDNINRSIQVAVNATTDADINLVNFETISANNSFVNTLKSDNVNNEWHVNGLNSGRLNDAINFTGFANLSGGNLADRVVFATTQANVTGHIDLGAGQDTLDTSNSNRDMLIQINSAKNSTINGALSISNIETITGSEKQNNRLIGDNFANTWTLDDINSGQISSAQTGVLSFTNFNNITGGNLDDHFIFEATGRISGLVDGGLHSVRDIVNLSSSNSSNVLIAVGGQNIGFANIEKYIGNNVDSIFSAANTANSWSLTGANRGVLNGSVEFENFAFINGGNAVDDFIINNATITGTIHAGDGDDRFDVRSSTITGKISGGNDNDRFTFEVVSGMPGVSDVDGGNGENRLTITGGDEEYSVNHYAGHLEYVSGTGNNQSILYSNMSNIFDNVVANKLSISGTSAADTFHMLAGRYSVNNSTIVNYDNKPNLFINGGSGDQVIVDGTVAVDSTIAFNNLQISAINEGKIQARTLELANTGSVGSAGNRLNTAITELSLNTTNGAVYLEEQDALILKDLNVSMTDLIDLKVGGDLSAVKSLDYSGDFNLQSLRGNINLSKNNALTGVLNMDAAGHIVLGNIQSLTLNNLTAQSVNINSGANIKGTGVFSVAGLAILEAGDQISLLNQANDINQLRIKNADVAEIFDKTGFTTADLQVADRIDLRSSGAVVLGSSCGINCNDDIGIITKNLTVQSESTVTVAKPVAAVDTIKIASNSIVVNDSLTSRSISLDVSGTLALNDGGNLLGQGDSVIELNAGSIEQYSIVRSNGNLNVTATGNIVMFEAAVMESLNGNVNLSSNDLQLAVINANNGSVITGTRGSIKDGNGNATNITAKRWQADTNNGIGSGFGKDADAIETQIEVLSVRNAGQLTGSSNVAITNNETLLVEQLRNNGSITLTNKNGDIILDNSKNDDFNLANPDARSQGGVINAGLNGGNLLLSLGNGMVRAENKANKKNPDIIADTASFTFDQPFDFGERNRKIVMHIPETYNQNSRLSFVVWYLNRPINVNDLSKVPSDSVISGRDQLIQIEGLSEIDPAIFTSIKNYVHDEVAILLPVDQRFDEEDL